MATPNGIITRKDIITDDALQFGSDYAAELEKAIAANKQLLASSLELSKVMSSYRKIDNNQQFLEAKQSEILISQKIVLALKEREAAEISLEKIRQESIKTEKLRQQSENQSQKVKQATVKLTIEERVQNELNNKALKQGALEKLGLIGAYQKLNKERTDAKRKLLDLISTENTSTDAIKKAQKEFDVLAARVKKADDAVNDFTKNVGNYPTIGKLTGSLKNLVGAFGLTAGIAGIASVIKGAFETIKQFNQSIADLSAITGASGKDLDYLKNQAILLGRETKGGAVAVVEAYKLIASAKPELLENVNSLNQVTEATLTLSKAAGIDLPSAATALTDALNQFNAPASEAGVFVDALANGAKYGAAEIPQVTDALLKFGSVARSSNISIKESTALVELLAENGLKGADAGTALRNVLLKLSAPDALPRKAQQAIKDLGISFEFLKDKSIPIQQKLEALKPILKDNAKLVEVFGLENTVAAQNIIGHTERLKELTIKMGEVGTAEEQAIKRSNTLEGSFDKLGSAYDSFILSLSDRNSLGTALKFVTDELTSTVEGWRKIFTSNEKLKEEEMAILRKKEIDSILKSYSDTNKYNDGQLILVKKSNSEQIKNNAERVKLLISQNKENFYYTNQEALKQGAFSDKTEKDLISYKKNTAEILRLNKESRTLINKNDGLDNLLNSRKIVKNKNNTPNSNEDSDNDKKAAKAKLDLQKQLNDSLYELQKQRLEQTIKFNEEIVADDSQSDEMRIQATYNSQQKQKDLLLLTKKHLLDNDKLTVNDRIRINEDYSSKLKELKKKSQKEIDKINEFDEASYQKSLEDKISKNNVAMNSELEVENRKFLALGDLEKQSQKDRENAIENHEKTVFDIKKKYAISALKLQISNLETELIASDALPEKEKLSSEKRQKIAETLTKAKLDLSEEELKNNDDKNKKTVDKEKITAEKLLEISQSLTSALSDLANAIFERKITNINEEITKNDEYYAKQIELAGNDQRKKDILQKEAEKKRQVLEKKKREEEHKQAVFNKAVTIAQIAIQTALSVMKGFADSGYVGAILAGVLGAISLATAIATPIPKYKMGRKGGPAEIAMINDGGVQEVVTDASGNNARTTTNKNAIVSLMKGDIVHKSMEDYQKYIRNSILSNVNAQARKTSDFQAKQYFENRHDKEMLEELKKTNKALEKQKTEVNLTNKIDIGHEIWKLGNTNWSK